jgi:Spy/CpxP family protein refolding chaperone
MMKWCLSMLALTAVLAATAVAQPPEGKQRGERPAAGARGNFLDMLAAAGVKPTEEQKAKLDEIAAEMRKLMSGIRDAEDRRAAFEKVRPQMTELREKALAVLTAEQKETLQKYREQQRERGGEGRGGRPRPAPKT